MKLTGGNDPAALRDHVVKAIVIEGMFNAPVKPGGKWAWGGSMKVTEETERFAAARGIVSVPHSSTPEFRVETALCVGDIESARLHAIDAHPNTKKFVDFLCSSPGYQYLSGLLRSGVLAQKILRPDDSRTMRVGGMRVDRVVRVQDELATSEFRAALATINSPHDLVALKSLLSRQETDLGEILNDVKNTPVYTNTIESLARPLSMIIQKLSGIEVTGNGNIRVSAGEYQKVLLSKNGVAVWGKDGYLLAIGVKDGMIALSNSRKPCSSYPDEEFHTPRIP